MNTPDVLSRLQALLERVRARSRAQGLPRFPEVSSGASPQSGVDVARPAAPAAPPAYAGVRGPEPASLASEAAAVSSPQVPVRPEPWSQVVERTDGGSPAFSSSEESLGVSTWTPTPPAAEPEIVVDVEETEAVRAAEYGVDVTEPEARSSESDQRLRAAEAAAEPEVEVAAASPSDLAGAQEPAPSASSAEIEPEAPTRAVEALEEEERAPASSRRPVVLAAEDHLAQMAFGAEESPIPHHTPPPESGRLPSASVEEFDDATGIRGARVEETGRKVISHLAAESTRANLDRGDTIVETLGEARRFAPVTFLELLDASLEL